MREIKLFINNQWVDCTSGKNTNSLNPADSTIVARVHLSSAKDIDRALEAAQSCLHSQAWRQTTLAQRSQILEDIAEKIKARKDEFIEAEINDSGAVFRKAKTDIQNSINHLKVVAKQMLELNLSYQDKNYSRPSFSRNEIIREPVGVCAQIIPWNFPLLMAAWKIAPVIATGCTSVLKPAIETPLTASLLAEVISQTALPPGVINMINGGAAEGQYLVRHKIVRKIAFTGSTQVGKQIMQHASVDLKRVTLELGGKSANIIFEDADFQNAIEGALYGFLFHSGQACTSGSRILVQRSIYNEFKEALLEKIKKVKVGAPKSPDTGFGPVINKKQGDSILAFIEEAKSQGATLLCGGSRLKGLGLDSGWYIAPTVFEANSNHRIYNEEVFGPVATLTPFDSMEEAIGLANQTNYGLAAGVWTNDANLARSVAGQLEAGTVWINEYHLLNSGIPFGGFKQSGLGREFGIEGLESYLETKHLWVSDCLKKPWFSSIY